MIREEIYVKSSLDGSMQPSLYFAAEEALRPLLVGLHTWSFGRENQIQYLLGIAKKHDFNLLLPEFRGPNLKDNPMHKEACGSIFAKTDIKDAIDYIKESGSIDENNIFLVGLSGGGHMAMLMAGFIPEYFRAIAPFVPISDIGTWLKEAPEFYYEHIIACTGGDGEEMYDRSPMKYIDKIAKANIKIFHGKYDNVVPVTQSIKFYNLMMERYPEAKCYIDVFDGGHQFSETLCENWLLSQYRKKDNCGITG